MRTVNLLHMQLKRKHNLDREKKYGHNSNHSVCGPCLKYLAGLVMLNKESTPKVVFFFKCTKT